MLTFEQRQYFRECIAPIFEKNKYGNFSLFKTEIVSLWLCFQDVSFLCFEV
jgi:hypothetical protein